MFGGEHKSSSNDWAYNSSQSPKYRHQRKRFALIRRVRQFSKDSSNNARIRIKRSRQELRHNCLAINSLYSGNTYPSIRLGETEKQEADQCAESSQEDDGFSPDSVADPSPEWVRETLACKKGGCNEAEVECYVCFCMSYAESFDHEVCIRWR